MARALRAWDISPSGKNSVRNLQYGPRTRLVRGNISCVWSKILSRFATRQRRLRAVRPSERDPITDTQLSKNDLTDMNHVISLRI